MSRQGVRVMKEKNHKRGLVRPELFRGGGEGGLPEGYFEGGCRGISAGHGGEEGGRERTGRRPPDGQTNRPTGRRGKSEAS